MKEVEKAVDEWEWMDKTKKDKRNKKEIEGAVSTVFRLPSFSTVCPDDSMRFSRKRTFPFLSFLLLLIFLSLFVSLLHREWKRGVRGKNGQPDREREIKKRQSKEKVHCWGVTVAALRACSRIRGVCTLERVLITTFKVLPSPFLSYLIHCHFTPSTFIKETTRRFSSFFLPRFLSFFLSLVLCEAPCLLLGKPAITHFFACLRMYASIQIETCRYHSYIYFVRVNRNPLFVDSTLPPSVSSYIYIDTDGDM